MELHRHVCYICDLEFPSEEILSHHFLLLHIATSPHFSRVSARPYAVYTSDALVHECKICNQHIDGMPGIYNCLTLATHLISVHGFGLFIHQAEEISVMYIHKENGEISSCIL